MTSHYLLNVRLSRNIVYALCIISYGGSLAGTELAKKGTLRLVRVLRNKPSGAPLQAAHSYKQRNYHHQKEYATYKPIARFSLVAAVATSSIRSHKEQEKPYAQPIFITRASLANPQTRKKLLADPRHEKLLLRLVRQNLPKLSPDVVDDILEKYPVSFAQQIIERYRSDELFAHQPSVLRALRAASQGNYEQARAWGVVAAREAQQPIVEPTVPLPPTLDMLLEDISFHVSIASDFNRLTEFGLLERAGIKEHNAHLRDMSPYAQQGIIHRAKAYLKILNTYSREHLSKEQRVSYDILRWKLNFLVSSEKFLYHKFYIRQFFGIDVFLSMLLTQHHRLETREDVDNYVKRLAAIPKHFDTVIAYLKHQRNLGIVAPHSIITQGIAKLEKTIASTPDAMLYYTHLRDKLLLIEIPEQERTAILERALKIIETRVYPAYRILIQFCKSNLLSSHNHGLWAQPNGAACYQNALKKYTTTDLTPQEIHEIGLKEVAKTQHELRKLLQKEGFDNPELTIGELLQQFNDNPNNYYPNTEQGRKAYFDHFKRILERVSQAIVPFFDFKGATPVSIEPIPREEEDGGPIAYYLPPSVDGSRSGIFFVNRHHVPINSIATLTVHEAIPGHHSQIGEQLTLKNIPLGRKVGQYSAYTEGWALYVEQFANDHDILPSTPDKIGFRSSNLSRAARLVVDTGIHYKRWSREQGIQYLVKECGMTLQKAIIEVDRYYAVPGHACSYMIGKNKIEQLRNQAQAALGNQFTDKEFHTVVLSVGSAPLAVLERVVHEYIQEKLKEAHA